MKRLFIISLSLSAILAFSCKSTKNIESLKSEDTSINTKETESPTLLKDGSSFENAIVVKSIAEEYQYVSKVCPNCSMVMQSLVFEKDKPYDILEFQKTNDETVHYYFDISKFYGKW
ncbi:hypothetical protein ACFLSE_05370 [Bacteroidota bacterium]